MLGVKSASVIASELGYSVEQVSRDIDFLERTGVIKRIEMSVCGGNCSGCSTDGAAKAAPAVCLRAALRIWGLCGRSSDL